MNTYDKIYKVVCDIPKGKVATYGLVATLVGNPKLSRVVGYALHVNPKPGIIPCHRVVNRMGRTTKAFAFGGEDIQKQLLESEGIIFQNDGSIDMNKYCWNPENYELLI